MLNKISRGIFAVMIAAGFANEGGAVTIAELAKMNSEAIQIDAEIALAKKKEDLAKLKPASNQQSTQTVLPAQAKKKDPHEEIEGLVVKAIFGDITNQKARMEINGAIITRGRGENVYSWTIAKVKNDQVLFVHEGKTPKDTLEKIVLLTGAGQQLPAGRDALRASPIAPATPIAPIPVVPAPASR